jgi:hypothetical protein
MQDSGLSAVTGIASALVREVLRGGGFRSYALAVVLLGAFAPHFPRQQDPLSRLQLTVVYGLGLPVLVLCVFTIVAAMGSLARDIDRRRVFLVASKPVGRSSVLFGKLLGVALLDAALLALVLGVFAASVAWQTYTVTSSADLDRLRERLFTSRVRVTAEPPLVAAEAVEKAVEELRRTAHGRGVSHRELEARARRRLQTLVIDPEEATTLRFAAPRGRRRPDGTVVIQYRFRLSPPLEAAAARVRWRVEGLGPAVEREVEAGQDVLADFELPASLPSDGKGVEIRLQNLEPKDSAVKLLVAPESVEVLYPHSGLWANLLRAALVFAAQLGFLAVVGLLGPALFSLSTSGLLAAFVFFASLSSSFLRESLLDVARAHGSDGAAAFPAAAVVWVGERVLDLLPDFAAADPLSRLADGRALTWGETGGEVAGTYLVRGAALLLLACWLWRRRELAVGSE